MKIILASNSPRRKEILKNAGYDFKIIPSDYEEHLCNKRYSKALIENCAFLKAKDVLEKNKPDNDFIIVSADTVVVADDTILGKPVDKQDAFNILKKLSNKTHFVQTSVCLLNSEICLKDSEITFVTFKKLSDDEIISYINDKKPFDKAGSYGIQDDGFNFASNLDGNLDNVIGFPLQLFQKMLNSIQ